MLFWGASWPIANVLSGYMNLHEFIAYRYVIVTLSMVAVLRWMKLSFAITWREFLAATLAALLLVYYTKYYFLATKYGAPGLAGAVVTTLMPILVYVFTLPSRAEKTHARDWGALLLGALGVGITMGVWQFQASEVLSAHYDYLLGAATCWALLSLTGAYAKNLHPAVFSFYLYLMTSVIDIALFLEPNPQLWQQTDGVFWFNFLTLTFISTTFATTVYFLGVKRLGAKRSSAFTFLVPFFALGLSAIFLGEVLQWHVLLGVSLTIFSLIILNRIKIGFYNRDP